jgi:hypothetical protein
MAAAGGTTATLSALTFAAAAASSLLQFKAQSDQASAMEQSAAHAEGQRLRDEDRQRQQQYQQDASEVNAYETEARRERAALEALIGEYGGGGTGDRQLASLGVRQGQDRATLADNASRRQQEISLGAAADIGSIRSKGASVARPSLAGLGLSLASSSLQFAGRQQSIKDPYGHLERQAQAQPRNPFHRTH